MKIIFCSKGAKQSVCPLKFLSERGETASPQCRLDFFYYIQYFNYLFVFYKLIKSTINILLQLHFCIRQAATIMMIYFKYILLGGSKKIELF